ncbi:MAG: hydroxyethylthiazole kinase [Micrococcales bacterium]|nr:hydroxyethylthiazole kinase [Micrococcales bacterium]
MADTPAPTPAPSGPIGRDRPARTASLGCVLAAVRERAPLVHCIGAAVTAPLVADGLLAAGARPMMTDSVEEAPTLVTVADALLVNLGQLSAVAAQAIPPTVDAAVAEGIPWVLDPAAIGRAPVRTPLARDLLALRPAVVRGNASEVRVLAGEGTGGRGADSTDGVEAALAAARQTSASGPVVAASGPVDVVVHGGRRAEIARGTPLLTRVTGTGCLLGGLTAACAAVAPPWEAAVTATVWLAVAGEDAAVGDPHPGTFRVRLLDALAAMAPDRLDSVHLDVHEEGRP